MSGFSSDNQQGSAPVGELISIYTTIDNESNAMHLATDMVNSGLVACGNVLASVKSVYVYDNQLNLDNECVVIFKTAADKADQAMERLHELHPYDVPCITAHDVSALPDYIKWVESVTRHKHL